MGKGVPLPGDRSVHDAHGYEDEHANDVDTLDGIHHKLGTHAWEAAPGDHTHVEADITDMVHDAVKLQGNPIASTGPTDGQALVWNGSEWAPASPSTNATQLQGRDISSTAPADQQVLQWSASQSAWRPGAVSGGGGGAAGYYATQLFRVRVGAGGQASFDLDNIDGGYDYLEILVHGKSMSTTASSSNVLVAYNGDTNNSNYLREHHQAGGSYHGLTSIQDRQLGFLGTLKADNVVGQLVATIVNYSGPFYKMLTSKSTVIYTDLLYIKEIGLQWKSTNAITRITLTDEQGSGFAEGTLCVINGYKNHE